MQYPKFIQNLDTIGVTAPSAGSENELDIKRLELAKSNISKLGYKVKETPNCRTTNLGRSSSAIDRANQLSDLYLDKEVKCIIGLAGGEFLLEMLSYVNFESIKNNIKWIQGYSDMTGLLFTITTNLDIATLYANNFRGFAMKEWHKSLKDNFEILKGHMVTQESFNLYESDRTEKQNGDESYNLDAKVNWVNLNCENINVQGRIIGGCLDIILNLVGTKFDKTSEFLAKYKEDGIIWFFDNCELSSEEIVRAMWQLKEAGYFKYTKAIIFGRSATDRSYYEVSFKEAVQTSLEELNIPIIIDADIGHKPPMMTIINGAIAQIRSSNGAGKIKFLLE